MNVKFFTGFKKDINSTKIPTTEASVTLDCTVFEPCSILSPSFILSASAAGNIFRGATYCHVSTWNRYYWINDRRFVDGQIVVDCSIDVLASYKSAIGGSTQYVLRSASEANEQITDMAYPLTGVITTLKVDPDPQHPNPFKSSVNDGCFIVGIVGEADAYSTRFGAVNYYEFNATELSSFMNALMSNQNDWLSVQTSDLSDSTTKMILNPMQYITSCQWIPLGRTSTPTSHALKFGWWDIANITHGIPATTGGMPGRDGIIGFITTNVRHPQAERGAYMNKSPYSTYQIYIPQVGYIPIPSDIYAQTEYITVKYTLDYPTGTMILDIYGNSKEDGTGTVTQICRTSAQIGVDIPLAQIAVDTIGTANSFANTVTGAVSAGLTGNIFGAIIGAITGAIDTSVHAATPIPNIMANMGCISTFQYTPRIECIYQEVAPDAPDLLGKPLCDNKQIGTLSGFVQCGTAHIDAQGATRAELESVENYLKEGFFYE